MTKRQREKDADRSDLAVTAFRRRWRLLRVQPMGSRWRNRCCAGRPADPFLVWTRAYLTAVGTIILSKEAQRLTGGHSSLRSPRHRYAGAGRQLRRWRRQAPWVP